MTKAISAKRMFEALITSGIADEMTTRVVLDIPANGFVTAYVQKIATVRVLDVVATMTSDTVVFRDADPTKDQEIRNG